MDRHMVALMVMLCVMVFVESAQSYGRYKSCDEGCCAHEICLHGICYPDAGCRFGCPDGTCDPAVDRCRPPKPCKNFFHCDMGTACTMNFNLGYKTCQYDLNIGSTLCSKRRRSDDRE